MVVAFREKVAVKSLGGVASTAGRRLHGSYVEAGSALIRA
jgi:hypothetical protein